MADMECENCPKEESSDESSSDVTDSCGFKAYFKSFRKKNPCMPKCEAKKKAACKYKGFPECKKDKYRQKGCCKPKCGDVYGEVENPDGLVDACAERKSCGDKKDTCCKKRDPDDDNCCEPSGTGSLGFRNYFKMFRCRYPYYSKCAALAKAKCKYCQLGQKAKAKYRLMGCNPKICCKPRRPCPC